tara:strand:- start:2230 stop:2622 length:393 start_codon:yes stop_codon:yes gene_type:complete
MKYNFDYVINYSHDIETDANDTQYRKNILSVFSLNEEFKEQVAIDDIVFFKQLSDNVNDIFVHYKNNEQILSLIKKIKDKIRIPFELTNDVLFLYLFRFDLFHIFHKCLRDLNNDKAISDANFKDMVEAI